MPNINGTEYRLPELDPFQSFALASKISPILGLMALQEDRVVLAARFPQSFTALAGDMRMSREDKDEVLRLCLSGISRGETGGSFSPIMVNGHMMFKDIDMSVMLKLVWETIVQNKLIDFFSDAHSNSTEQPGGQAASSGSTTRTAM